MNEWMNEWMKVAHHIPTKVSLKHWRKSIGKAKRSLLDSPKWGEWRAKTAGSIIQKFNWREEKSVEDKEVTAKMDGMCQWLTED